MQETRDIYSNGVSELFEQSFEKLKLYYPYSQMPQQLEQEFHHHAKLFENALKTAPDRAEKLYVLDKQSVWLHRSIRKIQALIDSAEIRR